MEMDEKSEIIRQQAERISSLEKELVRVKEERDNLFKKLSQFALTLPHARDAVGDSSVTSVKSRDELYGAGSQPAPPVRRSSQQHHSGSPTSGPGPGPGTPGSGESPRSSSKLGSQQSIVGGSGSRVVSRQRSFKNVSEDVIKRCRAQQAASYQLSQDLHDKQVEMLERKYGGSLRARRAARTIQRAYRHYCMNRNFQKLRHSVGERRLSKRLSELGRSNTIWTDRISANFDDNFQLPLSDSSGSAHNDSFTRDIRKMVADFETVNNRYDYDPRLCHQMTFDQGVKVDPRHPRGMSPGGRRLERSAPVDGGEFGKKTGMSAPMETNNNRNSYPEQNACGGEGGGGGEASQKDMDPHGVDLETQLDIKETDILADSFHSDGMQSESEGPILTHRPSSSSLASSTEYSYTTASTGTLTPNSPYDSYQRLPAGEPPPSHSTSYHKSFSEPQIRVDLASPVEMSPYDQLPLHDPHYKYYMNTQVKLRTRKPGDPPEGSTGVRQKPVPPVRASESSPIWKRKGGGGGGTGQGGPGVGMASGMMMGGSGMGMSAPGMGMSAPSMGMSAPSMGMSAPGMGVSSPGMGMSGPSMGMMGPGMGMSGPGMGMGGPGMGMGNSGGSVPGTSPPMMNGTIATMKAEGKRMSNVSETSEADSADGRCSSSPSSENMSTENISVASDSSVSSYQRKLRMSITPEQHSNSLRRPNDKHRKRLYRIGLNLFNKKPEKGLDFLLEQGFVEGSPISVARFLISRKGLSKQMIGEFLGNLMNPFNMEVLHYFCQDIDLSGLQVDVALRKFNGYFRMPGEAQKIERLMEAFADRYCQCNPDQVKNFKTSDTVFLLAFAIIMLNTDLHNSSIKEERKMKLEDFIKNLRGIDDGDDLDPDLLAGIYERIKQQEFRAGVDQVTQVMKVEQTIVGKRPQLALSHRRLVCYCRLYEVHDPNKKEKIGLHQREVFLFNDLLLVTKIFSKKKTGITYNFKASLSLCGMQVYLFETPHYQYGVQLTNNLDRKPLITFNARNDHDRQKFVEDLKESILETNGMEQLRIEEEMHRHGTTHNTLDKHYANDDSRVHMYELAKPLEPGSNRLSAPECALKKCSLSNSLTDLSAAAPGMRRGNSGASLDSGVVSGSTESAGSRTSSTRHSPRSVPAPARSRPYQTVSGAPSTPPRIKPRTPIMMRAGLPDGTEV